MKTIFRKKTLTQFFSEFEERGRPPLDLTLNQFFRRNSQIGSNDRRNLQDTAFGIVRNLTLLDGCLRKDPSWEERIELYLTNTTRDLQKKRSLSPYQRLSLSKEIYSTLKDSFTEEEIEAYAKITSQRAPITLRVNLLKTTREALFEGWKNRYDCSLCEESPTGIVFHKKINFPVLSEFKKGLFEIQDESSQLVSQLVAATPGQEVLDYCAGGGGKSLAIAPGMNNKGQLFLHDVRERALISAKKRLKRAGVQNAQTVFQRPALMKRMIGRMDWILTDVPCTGSGTWRRNPDQKWKYSREMLNRLVEEQRSIVEEALPYLRVGGRLVYATCSVFPQENEDQIAYFKEKFGLIEVAERYQCMPISNGKDGFFAAVLANK